MSIETADILRKLFIGQASVLLIMAVWTIVRYASKQKAAVKNDQALPSHVALVASSYVVFILYISFDLYDRFGLPVTWRLPFALSGGILGCAAMAFLVSHLSVRRYLRTKIDHEAEKVANEALIRNAEAQERRILRMEEVGQQTHDALQGIQKDTLQRIEESVGLAAEKADIASDKADNAYHEANQVNEKIASVRTQQLGRIEEIIEALEQIKEEARTAREEARTAKDTAKEVSDKADGIG